MRVEFSPLARLEILEAEYHYASISPKLASDFLDQVIAGTDSLSVFYKYEIKYRNVRTYRLHRFPYKFHYVVYEEQSLIRVISVLHERSIEPK
jgi:plasmid stabilization system protein ParE